MKRMLLRGMRAWKRQSTPVVIDTIHRTEGDKERDRGNWFEAAKNYRAHLKLSPGDVAIWVQCGHALKEDGRLAEADDAYRQALKLSPKDADLLLSYGHLSKMRERFSIAADYYTRSANADGNTEAVMELASRLMGPHLTPDAVALLDLTAGQAIAPLCQGLTLLNSNGVFPSGQSRFELIGDDPWLQLKPREAPPHARLAELEIFVSPTQIDNPFLGQLFIDYGSGFVPQHCLSYQPDASGCVSLILAAPRLIRSLRLDLDDKPNCVTLDRLVYRPDLAIDAWLNEVLSRKDFDLLNRADLEPIARRLNQVETADEAMALSQLLSGTSIADQMSYAGWIRRWITPSGEDYAVIDRMTEAFERKPTFSFVIPVYNTPVDLLAECLDSLLGQTYPHFEICIADDNSPDPAVGKMLEHYVTLDPRIKVVRRTHNGHISAASNSALALATGDFVVLVDHDDLVPDYCLFVVAHYINQHPQARILFSDEDKISPDGDDRFTPYFKGSFDPFLMYGHNMVSHLGVYERDLLQRIGGFRVGLEGSQDYDLLLRAYETVGEDSIVHIPHVLYHWRAIPGSTAVSADQKSYAIHAARTAINGHFERTGSPLLSVEGFAAGNTGIGRTRNLDTFVSIIIPTRDGLADLKDCIDSIAKFDQRATEIIIVDNGSEDPETLEYLEELQDEGRARVMPYPHPFNFSEINNFAAQHAKGDILCFLNNDTEVLSRDWLDRARALLSLPTVGMVGARLLYPDGTLQHFGVSVGTAKHRVASHPHWGLPGNASGYFSKARLMQQFSAVTAACMFVTREAFESAGGFDPSLRVAYNDVDLCLKVRAAGFKIVGDPDILLVHKESRTRGSDADGEKAARLDAEAAVMRERWGPTLDADPFYSPNHSLDRNDFGLAKSPRVPMPWKHRQDTLPEDNSLVATPLKNNAELSTGRTK